MSQNELIRAWKAGRQQPASAETHSQNQPAGCIDLSEADLDAVTGARMCLPGEPSYWTKRFNCTRTAACGRR